MMHGARKWSPPVRLGESAMVVVSDRDPLILGRGGVPTRAVGPDEGSLCGDPCLASESLATVARPWANEAAARRRTECAEMTSVPR